MSVLRTSVKYYRLKLLNQIDKTTFRTSESYDDEYSNKRRKVEPIESVESDIIEVNKINGVQIIDEDASINKGSMFSKEGPAPYSGDILEQPDLIWTEDVWDKSKEEEAVEKIKEQGDNVSEYWKAHYENSASRYWHQFYNRNQDHFYKDRHYLHIVFPEFLIQPEDGSVLKLFEVGCGVGNAFLPLLEVNPKLEVIACDIAKSAIGILQQHILDKSLQDRVSVSVVNIVEESVPPQCEYMDLALCLFVLSAVPPAAHLSVFQKLSSCLKPGGKLLFRDYGRYDEAQLRFKKGSKLDDNFYVRQDGTCAYFFSTEDLESLAKASGFRVEECYSILRQYANRQQKKARHRNWIHAKFVKLW